MGGTLVYGGSTTLRPRGKRVRFVRPVHVRQQAGEAQRLMCSNLSDGGMFIRTPVPPQEGTPVDLSLEARGRTLPFARGEVVFCLPEDQARVMGCLPGFGLRFTSLEGRARALVERLVEICPPSPSEAAVPFPNRELMRPQVDPFGGTPHPAEPEPAPVKLSRFAFRPRLTVGAAAVLAIAGYLLWPSGGAPPQERSARVATPQPPPPLAEPAAAASPPVAPAPPPRSPVTVAMAVASTPEPFVGPLAIAASGPATNVKAPAGPPALLELAPENGALAKVRVFSEGNRLIIELARREHAEISNAASLRSPPGVVVDVDGEAPAAATKHAGAGAIKHVRFLPREGGGTRMVLSLDRAPFWVRREGDTVTLFYPDRRRR